MFLSIGLPIYLSIPYVCLYCSLPPWNVTVLFFTWEYLLFSTWKYDCNVFFTLYIYTVLYLEIYVNAVFTEYDCTVLSWEHDFIIYYIAVLFSTWEYDLTFLFWEHDFVIIYL